MTDPIMMDKIKHWANENLESVVSDLQEFARMESVSRADLSTPGAPFGPDVKRMLDHARARAEAYGFHTEDHEGYCASVYFGNREHTLGVFGHLDVVPVGEGWIYPPFGATRVGDFLIGRGVHDNKLAIALGLGLMRMFRELQLPLRHGIRLVMGGAEETGMRDMAYFAKTQVMPAASIVPDSAFPANYAQKGMLLAELSMGVDGGGLIGLSGGAVSNMVPPTAKAILDCPVDAARAALSGAEGVEVSFVDGRTEVVARGMAAHAARPWYGISAIHRLSAALAASDLVTGKSLQAARAVARLSGDTYGEASGIAREDAETGKTTQVVGLISLEDGRVRLSVDCRLSIPTDLADCRAAFEAYAKKEGFQVDSLTVKKPFYMPKGDPRIRALQAVYREVTGRDDAPYTTGGGTYSRELLNAVTFGPGFPDSPRPDFLPEGHGRAHEPDEAQSIPEIETMLVLYAAALNALDGIADEGREM